MWYDHDPAVRLRAVLNALRLVPRVSTDAERGMICAVIVRVAEEFRSSPNRSRVPGGDWPHGSSHPRVRAALEVLLSRYHDDHLSLPAVAREVNVSCSRLSHLIKAGTGFGFLAHLQGVRILRAIDLLENRTLTVKEVAALSGFLDTAALDHAFRRWLHMTPTEFRQMSRHPPRRLWRAVLN